MKYFCTKCEQTFDVPILFWKNKENFYKCPHCHCENLLAFFPANEETDLTSAFKQISKKFLAE